MQVTVFFIIFGLVLAIALWQLVVWMVEIQDKNRKYRAASAQAESSGKPMLVIGGPWGGKQYRHWVNKPAHGGGDVCMDIDPRAIKDHPCGILASVTHIPCPDKTFGAAFASHLLEHLPTAEDAMQALAELDRVADAVYIAYPSKQSVGGWITAGHKLWIWQKGQTTFVEQRRSTGEILEYTCKNG